MIGIGEQIKRLREIRSMTQQQLAVFLGVSKSAVSKWERGLTYPDIVLIPLISNYFNVSIDKLFDYKPEISKKKISDIYVELSKSFVSDDPHEVFSRIDDKRKEYYYSHELLLQLGLLELNHMNLLVVDDKNKRLTIIREDLKKIENESKDYNILNKVKHIESLSFLLNKEYQKVIDIFEKKDRSIISFDNFSILSYSALGKQEKAIENTQILLYQHIISAISLLIVYISLDLEYKKFLDVDNRLNKLFNVFNVRYLFPYLYIEYNLRKIVQYYKIGNIDQIISLIYEILDTYKNGDFTIKGDKFFYSIESWIEELDLGGELSKDKAILFEDFKTIILDSEESKILRGREEFTDIKYRIGEIENAYKKDIKNNI